MRSAVRGALARSERGLGGRRLVVVDIENVVGGACACAEAVTWAKRSLITAVGLVPDDHIVIGMSHIGLLAVGCNWPNLRYVVRSGADGADLALLDVLDENVAARFDKVILASGDGIFTDQVAALTSQGLGVTVVGHREGISRRLALAASEVVYLDRPFEGVAFPTEGARDLEQVAA